MKIKTIIPVTYNSGISSQEQGLVTGTLRMCMQDLNSGGYNFNYTYKSDSGVDLGSNNLSLSKVEINAMHESIKAEIPKDLNYTDTTMYMYYLGMKLKMAQTFGVETSDIEIIVD